MHEHKSHYYFGILVLWSHRKDWCLTLATLANWLCGSKISFSALVFLHIGAHLRIVSKAYSIIQGWNTEPESRNNKTQTDRTGFPESAQCHTLHKNNVHSIKSPVPKRIARHSAFENDFVLCARSERWESKGLRSRKAHKSNRIRSKQNLAGRSLRHS